MNKRIEQLRDAYRQFARNFRWGDCADCPRDSNGHVYPEFCPYTLRYDHQLTADSLAEHFHKHKNALPT